MQTSYLTESDDENNFVQQSITENDKNDFKNLEGNRLVKSSVKYVGLIQLQKLELVIMKQEIQLSIIILISFINLMLARLILCTILILIMLE